MNLYTIRAAARRVSLYSFVGSCNLQKKGVPFFVLSCFFIFYPNAISS